MKLGRILVLVVPLMEIGCLPMGDRAFDAEARNDLPQDVVVSGHGHEEVIIPKHHTMKLPYVITEGAFFCDIKNRSGHLIGQEEFSDEEMDAFTHGESISVVIDNAHFHPVQPKTDKKR